MGPRVTRTASLALAAAVSVLGAVGCLDDIVLNQMIATVRNTEGSTRTLHDFDMARQVSESSIGQLEAFYRLDPDDDDVQYMLTRAWSTVALRFILDAEERARAQGNDGIAAYQRLRLRAAFKRARFYAKRWMVARDDGFTEEATGIRAWIDDELDEVDDGAMLLWAGTAWLGHGWTLEPPAQADLAVGRAMLEQSAKLAPRIEHGLALTLLALDQATRDPAAAVARAREASTIAGGRYLPPRLVLALASRCAGQAHAGALADLVEAGDPLPAARLDNLVTIRLALRYASHPERLPLCPEPPSQAP